MTTRYTLSDVAGGEFSFWLHDVRALRFITGGGRSHVEVWLDGGPTSAFVELDHDTGRAIYDKLMQAWAEAT